MKVMGLRLKWVRQARNMKQSEIAKLVGIDQSTWSLYERGLRWPDHFDVLRLLAKLKISREYLLDGVLRDVEPELAIRLALEHPSELSSPRHTGGGKDKDRSEGNPHHY